MAKCLDDRVIHRLKAQRGTKGDSFEIRAHRAPYLSPPRHVAAEGPTRGSQRAADGVRCRYPDTYRCNPRTSPQVSRRPNAGASDSSRRDSGPQVPCMRTGRVVGGVAEFHREVGELVEGGYHPNEREFPFDDTKIGAPNVSEDSTVVVRRVVPSLARCSGGIVAASDRYK